MQPLSTPLVFVPVALATAVLMDVWAGLLHGVFWHRSLWPIHRSHHRARPLGQRFEGNDALSVTHAPVSIALILYGCVAAPGVLREVVFGIGLGMALFGLSYLVVHDGLVHRRLPVRWLLRFPYLRRVVRAHLIHHTGPAGRAPYAFFLAPVELALLTRTRATSSARAPGSTAPP